MINAETWMNLSGLVLSERCQSQKIIYFAVYVAILEKTQQQGWRTHQGLAEVRGG